MPKGAVSRLSIGSGITEHMTTAGRVERVVHEREYGAEKKGLGEHDVGGFVP